MVKPHHIRDFYADGVIFVTGSSGFLGKALVIKILRTFDTVRTVYVLMRIKKGQSSEQRFDEWLQKPVFDGLRRTQPDQLKKLVCVNGDMSLPQLGIGDTDLQRLYAEVNIVIHAAATVRFNEAIHVAVGINTIGTQQIMQMCTQMKRLKSVVHISTAYSNAGLSYVEEKIYPPVPAQAAPTWLWLLGMEQDKQKIEVGHPNTYTLTKAIAENVVRDYHDNNGLPVCIVRPSIITSAIAEPEPNWLDGMNSLSSFIMELLRGTLQCIKASKECNMDLIPIDYVCNLILSAAWYNIHHKNKADINVFHSATGQLNPLKWGYASAQVIESGRRNPSEQCLWYPGVFYVRNRIWYNLCDFVLHLLPAFCVDLLAGTGPKMVPLWKKRASALRNMEFFSNNNWIFDTTNTARLQKAVEATSDDPDFRFDVRDIDWKQYTANVCMSSKKHVFHENIDCLDHVPRMHKQFETTKKFYAAVKVILMVAFLLLVWNVLF